MQRLGDLPIRAQLEASLELQRTYQERVRTLSAWVNDEIEGLLETLQPGIAKGLARTAMRETVKRVMVRAAEQAEVVLERQRRVLNKEQ